MLSELGIHGLKGAPANNDFKPLSTTACRHYGLIRLFLLGRYPFWLTLRVLRTEYLSKTIWFAVAFAVRCTMARGDHPAG